MPCSCSLNRESLISLGILQHFGTSVTSLYFCHIRSHLTSYLPAFVQHRDCPFSPKPSSKSIVSQNSFFIFLSLNLTYIVIFSLFLLNSLYCFALNLLTYSIILYAKSMLYCFVLNSLCETNQLFRMYMSCPFTKEPLHNKLLQILGTVKHGYLINISNTYLQATT